MVRISERDIIKGIENPFLKLLKATEFLLFRMVLRRGFEDETDGHELMDTC